MPRGNALIEIIVHSNENETFFLQTGAHLNVEHE